MVMGRADSGSLVAVCSHRYPNCFRRHRGATFILQRGQALRALRTAGPDLPSKDQGEETPWTRDVPTKSTVDFAKKSRDLR